MSARDERGAGPATAAQLARMLQFGDSTFPIGAFSFSSGLESAIQKGVVTDAATLGAFARTAVEQAASGDGIGLVWAHRAAEAGDIDEITRIDQILYARKLSSETRTMSVRTGKKFAELGAHVVGSPLLAEWRERIDAGADAAYEAAAAARLSDMAGFAPLTEVLAAVHVKAHVRLFMN